MNEKEIKKENAIPSLDPQQSTAQAMAEHAEKAKAAIETVEREREEFRKLYAQANSEVLGLKQENRHLRDRLANREVENLRQTTLERERMNVQMQQEASTRELEDLLSNANQKLVESRKK